MTREISTCKFSWYLDKLKCAIDKKILFQFKLANFEFSTLEELIGADQNYFQPEEYLEVLQRISNKIPNNISVTTTDEVFFFEPILIDEIGYCYSFNSKIAPFLSIK